MDIVLLLMSLTALAMMCYAWYRVTKLRRKLPGGIMKSTSNILGELIGLFTIGFLALPFFPMLPQSSKDILVGVIFLFAALFAVIVINLFYMIAADLGF